MQRIIKSVSEIDNWRHTVPIIWQILKDLRVWVLKKL